MTRVVLDASVAVATALSLPYSPQAARLLEHLSGAEIYVPALWEYEVVSTLRKSVALGRSTSAEAEGALERMLVLPSTRVAPDPGLHRAALRWADRLGQVVAYDAQYLALAERLGAEFWTADRRLVERARESGLVWVRWVGEAGELYGRPSEDTPQSRMESVDSSRASL